MLIIACMFTLAACSKDKPATCSFLGTTVSDGSYEPAGETVNKYTCDAGIPSMNCIAYQTGSEYFRMTCEQKDAAVTQGAPSYCSLVDSDGDHAYLDGSSGSTSVYDCGVLYKNLRCFFFSSNLTSKEEMRCNLL